MQTARIVRPPDRTSRLAHWIATISGCRSVKLARQTSPSLRRRVRAARAARVTIDSSRGFDRRLSPTHTESKKPEASACSAVSRSVSGERPNRTARFGKLMPNRTGGGWVIWRIAGTPRPGQPLDRAARRSPRSPRLRVTRHRTPGNIPRIVIPAASEARPIRPNAARGDKLTEPRTSLQARGAVHVLQAGPTMRVGFALGSIGPIDHGARRVHGQFLHAQR